MTSSICKNHQDKGWAWMVLFAAFANNFISSFVFSVGFYVNQIILEGNIRHVTGSVFGSLHAGITTRASERFSYRVVIMASSLVATSSILISLTSTNIYVLFLTFSMIPGLCLGALYSQSIIMLNKYFNKYTSLANSLSFIGQGVGFIAMPIICEFIIETYTWRRSLFIVAGMVLHGCVFATIIRPIPQSTLEQNIDTSLNLKNDMKPEKKRIFINTSLYIYLGSAFLLATSSSFVFILGANFFHERDLTSKQIGYMASFIGCGAILSHPIIGCVMQLNCVNGIAMFIFFSIIKGIDFIMFITGHSFEVLALSSFLFGFTDGSLSLIRTTLPRILFDAKDYGVAFSLSLFVSSIGMLCGSTLSGFVYDMTSSYHAVFILNCGISFFSGFLLSPVLYWYKKSTLHNNETRIMQD